MAVQRIMQECFFKQQHCYWSSGVLLVALSHGSSGALQRQRWRSPTATIALSNSSGSVLRGSPTIVVKFSYGSGDAPTATVALSNGSVGALQRQRWRYGKMVARE
ncbi:hypothetical protein LR48_Vigan02g084000 [Vigna angularis]|uniref:Uncharacterized protein n=1 Tax=Phaseolus angularis TaxID=3914 RepID=A0A0L9TVV6_PHAAN|nr:hypothetical protein LR48_Vigan02g084000 [Vigna angularis]